MFVCLYICLFVYLFVCSRTHLVTHQLSVQAVTRPTTLQDGDDLPNLNTDETRGEGLGCCTPVSQLIQVPCSTIGQVRQSDVSSVSIVVPYSK